MSYIWQIGLIGIMAGVLGTGSGGLLVSLVGKPKQSFLGFLLAFSGGIMLAVVLQDLIPEALALGTFWSAAFGILFGAIILALINEYLPHSHPNVHGEEEKIQARFARAGLLLGLGIAMHNLPEGLAIGAGYIASEQLGLGLAIALALHNIPEGMAMAGPMVAGDLKPYKAVMWTAIAGLPMGIGALIGALFGSISEIVLSVSLGLAAGAMMYLVFHELLPGSRAMNSPNFATSGAVAGILVGLLALMLL